MPRRGIDKPHLMYGSDSPVLVPAAPSEDAGAPSAPAPQRISVASEIDHLGFGRFQVIALVTLGLANASDAVELLCLSFILPALDGNGTADRCGNGGAPDSGASGGYTKSSKAVLSAAIFVGMLAGGLVFGAASDAWGRRRALSLALGINAVFGALSAVTPVYGALFASRVVAGFGVGGSIPGVFSMAAEILPAKDRGFWLSSVAWWWMVVRSPAFCAPYYHPPPSHLDPLPLSPSPLLRVQGSIYAAGAAWLMLDKMGLHWQWFAAVCAMPAGLASFLVATVLPESPRFLFGKGDVAGASTSLLTIARWNGRPSRLSQGWELSEADASVGFGGGAGGAGGEEHEGAGLLSSVEASSSSGGDGGDSEGGEATPLALVPAKTAGVGSLRAAPRCGRGCAAQLSALTLPMRALFAPPLRRSTALLSVIWFALSFGWYGLILWVPTLFCEAKVDLDAYQDAFLVNAANLPGNIISALLMDRLGRKGVLWGSLLASCAAAIAFSFARTEATVLLASCSLNAMSTCSWNALDCLSTETFPTGLRTSAMGVLAAMGRLGSIVGQLVFGALLDASTTVALLCLAGGILGVGALAAMALPAFKELT